MKIIRTYILKELTGPFIFSLIIFTFVLLIGNIIKLAELVITKSVSITYIFRLFIYLVPFLLTYTLPMSILSAVLLGFGRLACDNEITAMRASGISLYKIGFPVIVVALMFSLFSVYLNDAILPKMHYSYRKLIKEVAIRSPLAYIEPGMFIKKFKDYIIFIYDIDKNKLRNVRIYQPQPNGPTRTIVANRGEVLTYPDKKIIQLKLIDGSSDKPNSKDAKSFFKLNFETYYITLNLSDVLNSDRIEKKPKEMSIFELKNEIKKLKNENVDIYPLLTEIHKKFALAFSGLIFVLVGLPLAIISRSAHKSSGFGISLAVIIIYYLLLAAGEAFSRRGNLPPFICIWFSDIFLLFVGVFLTFKMSRK